MFIRLSALLPAAALAAVVAAAPSALEARWYPQCTTGQLQCCDATYETSDPTITALLGTIGIALPNVQGLAGITCLPITAIGTGSGSVCVQQPVCCTDNQFNGVINFGCSPVSLNA